MPILLVNMNYGLRYAIKAAGSSMSPGVHIQWQRALGGSGDDLGRFVQQTSDGGYIVAGDTESNDGDVSGNHGGADFWVVKFNARQ